jgi:hypothetical protein
MCNRQTRTCIFITNVIYNYLLYIVYRYKLICHDCNTILIPCSNKKFSEELIPYFPMVRQRPHRRRHIQQFFYFCACIRCRVNVFAEPLPSHERGIHIQTHTLMAGIYEVRRWDGLRCYVIHTNYHKDWFRQSKVDRGIAQTNREHGDLICLLSIAFILSFGKKKSLCDHHAVCMFGYPFFQLLKAWTNLYATWHVYHGTLAHLYSVLCKSLPSVGVSICVSPIVARQRFGENPTIGSRQRLGKILTAATNTHAIIE